MTKYRIRLIGGRVIGPFLKEQLHELKAKGHITGKEEAQVFPTGNWGPISSFDFYSELMEKNKTSSIKAPPKEETFVIDLTKLRQKSAEKEIDKMEPAVVSPVEPLTETIRMEPPVAKPEVRPAAGATSVAKPKTKSSVELDLALDLDDLPSVEIKLDLPNSTVTSTAAKEPHVTKQAERQAFEVAMEDIGVDGEGGSEGSGDKTMLNPVAQKELEKFRQKQKNEEELRKIEEEKKAEEEQRRKESEALALQLQEEEKDESTRVLNLTSVRNELIQVAEQEEQVIEKVAKDIKKKKAEEEARAKEEEEGEDENPEEGKKKKKKLIFLVGAVLLAFALLKPEDGPQRPPFVFKPPLVEFPVPFDKADPKASSISFDQGKELFAKGGYENLVKSGILFKTAYENDLSNNAALNLLVRVYAEELKYSREKLIDAQVVFNIIQSKRPMLLKDPNGAIGLNLFYMHINKYEAAVDSTAKYLKLNPKNITPDLFGIYLKSLLKVGKLDVAKQIFTALQKAPDKNRYIFDALIDYHMLNQESDKAEELIDDAIKRNPHLVPFVLMKAEMLLKQKKFKEMEPYLKRAEDLALEFNEVNRAKFLELTGLLLAYKGKVEEATKILNASLKLDDSIELRMRLADLSSSKGELTSATDKLIAESKAIKLLNQAKEFLEKRNYELAMSTAARASDAYPGHIPSELFLAKMQMKLGQAEQSIKTLEDLIKKYPENRDINFAMIEAYVDTYKFDAAKNRLAIVSGVEEMRSSWEFASLYAKLYMRMGDSLQVVQWLKNSMNMNPLNDRDIFYLAETFLKRNNFDAAQMLLNKCMELDPINPDYRIAYAKLIYEKQDDQAAIGYLLTLQEEFGENPKILSEIAIMYYRAGKVKDFEAYKEKLAKSPSKDKALYEFLIKAALLDERFGEIPGYVEELLRVEPGDLEAMMTAGRILFENGKLKESAVWFKRVQEKLSTYPKVQYYIARIKLLAGEIDDPKNAEGKPVLDEKGKPVLGAIGLVQKDIKENGENDTSLVLLGEIYTKKGELIEAENYYKKAQKLNPRSYEALVGMADLSSKRNNHDLALDLYKKAMNLKTDEPVLHKKVGDVYRLLGQGALAMESYKMYLEMNPDATDKAQIESYINMMQ